jgi:hypothetical protein
MGGFDTRSRNPAKRGGSEGRSLSLRVVVTRLLYELIELTRPDIGLQLPVPGGPIELDEPRPKLSKLLGGESFDLSFDLLDVTHMNDPAFKV